MCAIVRDHDPRDGVRITLPPEDGEGSVIFESGTGYVPGALSTGMRRGEILGLPWADLSDDFGMAHIRRSLQTDAQRLHFAEPKTRRSRRAVALPESRGTLAGSLSEDKSDEQTTCYYLALVGRLRREKTGVSYALYVA